MIDDKCVEDIWNFLKNAIQKILKKDTSQMPKNSHGELYR